jgi:uncharacterized protein (TIGR04552 family)
MRPDILELDLSAETFRRDVALTLQDVEAVRLLLTGGSVVDWQRANFVDIASVDRFLGLLHLGIHVPRNRVRLRYVYNEAVSYLEEHLKLRFPTELRNPKDVREVFVWASLDTPSRRQTLSCVILKVMHVIMHMESADLKFRTPISEHRLIALANAQILAAASRMRAEGHPVLSFYGSEKSRSSLITKLLAKAENVAATVFDKLRFRIIVPERDDIVPTIRYLCQHVLPYNYAIPRQSHNTLVDKSMLEHVVQQSSQVSNQDAVTAIKQPANHHSGTTYRTVNFIVDFPVRVPESALVGDTMALGHTVFVLVEFQIVDEETARTNEQGENAHALYKRRQERSVAQRLQQGGLQDPLPSDQNH